jgi:hypothetical protein
LKTIKRLEENKLNGYQLIPNFNIVVCEKLDNLSLSNNINIQHAMNGGEFYIKELGYWVDGYDKENNVVYEYYEKSHSRTIERDERRKNEIIELLKCEFIIIYENNDEEYIKQLIDKGIENLNNNEIEILLQMGKSDLIFNKVLEDVKVFLNYWDKENLKISIPALLFTLGKTKIVLSFNKVSSVKKTILFSLLFVFIVNPLCLNVSSL